MNNNTFIHTIARAALTLTLALTATTAWAQTTETVSYIDADGTQKSVEATVLTGDITQSGFEIDGWGTLLMPAGWYVVKNSNTDGVDASCTKEIKATGDQGTIHIILADGAEMTVNGGNSDGFDLGTGYSLAIYGQSAGTGRLTVSSIDRSAINTSTGGITINGGIVTATSGDKIAIYSAIGDITINGGQVTATGGGNHVGIHGTITLGCRKLTDFIKSNGYDGSVTIKSGQTLYDGATAYSGTFYAGHTMTLRPFSSDDLAVNDDNTEYTIHTAEGWGLFCDMLAQSDKGIFSGKTVLLGNDIEVSRMAGSQYHDFCGTFDGQGNTLTVTLSGSSDRMAPFSYISNVGSAPAAIRNLNVVADITSSGQKASALVGEAWGTLTIEHCTVSGTIATSNQFAGGIIGSASTTPLNITDCHSSVTISSSISGDGTHGGFAGRVPSSATVNISGSVFDGKIVTTNGTTNCGGFVGHSENTASNNVTITNSLYAPADDDNTVSGGDCATFARNVVAEKITNSYYTRALGTAQGKAPRTVTAAADVTIEAVALTGTATQYNVSGITAYSGGGLQLGENLYYGSGDQLSLTLSNSEPAGVTLSKYTADGGTLNGNDTDGYTLTMPDADVTIGATWSATYIDEFGEQQSHDVTLLKGTETSLSRGWYVATGTLTYNHNVTLKGNVTLILADGCTMNIGSSDSRIRSIGILGYNLRMSYYYNLTICGQSAGTGSLNVYTTGSSHYCISGKEIIINGGNITADADGNNSEAIRSKDRGNVTINGGTVNAATAIVSESGNITINGGIVNASGGIIAIYRVNIYGGIVSATGGTYGIEAGEKIILGWTNPTDRITASSYYSGKSIISVKAGQKLIGEDGTIYTDATSSATLAALTGQTLRPYAETVTLKANLAPDHNRWTTFYCGYLPYTISGQACAYTAQYDAQNAQLTLSKVGTDGKQIPANCAVIIVAPEASSTVTLTVLTGDDPDTPANNDLQGVDQDTKLTQLGSEGDTFYVLGQTTVNNEPHFGFHRYTGAEMAARKAYLYVPGSSSNARSLDLVFGDVTGVNEVSEVNEVSDDSWYTLEGRKLNGKPSVKGMYINNGRKVVIK